MRSVQSYKYGIVSVILTILVFSAAIYTSCKRDACNTMNCQNGSACVNSKCVCPTYYSGNNCEINNDPCRAVVCKNGGTCVAGTCSCPTGSKGTFCDTVYRDGYNNTYKGNGTDNKGQTYWKSKLIFSNSGKSLTSMGVDVIVDTTADISMNGLPLPVTLTDFNATSESFTIPSITKTGYDGAFTYSGSGTITDTTATLVLTVVYPTAITTTYSFSNFRK